MPGHSVPLSEALPRSHYFLTVSRGDRLRTVAVRSALVHLLLLAVPLFALVGLGSTLYVAFHDDLVADMMRRQSAMQYAYEDRIDGLRQDLDRQAARNHADQAELDGRVHDLFTREARLEAHATAVAELAGSARAAAPPRNPVLPPEITGRVSVPPAGALGYAPSDKPHPLLEPAVRGPTGRPGKTPVEDHASLLDDPSIPIAERLRGAAQSLDQIERNHAGTLARLGAAARERVARIRDLIEDSGLSPERYLGRGATPAGVGGPFVPLPDGIDGAFGRALAEVRGTTAAAAQLDGALGRLPLAAPLSGRQEVTSPFGARLDPFLGRPALHTGVDLRDGYGTDIHATAGGRVVFAGTAGGYGNMVELDHGNGVSTRYAHMGAIAVSEGQTVARGAVVGMVGATGRATGPHLHYEVRVDGEPVDPMRFLGGAERLAALEAR